MVDPVHMIEMVDVSRQMLDELAAASLSGDQDRWTAAVDTVHERLRDGAHAFVFALVQTSTAAQYLRFLHPDHQSSDGWRFQMLTPDGEQVNPDQDPGARGYVAAMRAVTAAVAGDDPIVFLGSLRGADVEQCFSTLFALWRQLLHQVAAKGPDL